MLTSLKPETAQATPQKSDDAFMFTKPIPLPTKDPKSLQYLPLGLTLDTNRNDLRWPVGTTTNQGSYRDLIQRSVLNIAD